MKKTIGILAHVDAGKTTFSESLLYHTNTIRAMGRVDHKSSFLDDHPIERERGITVFSGYARMEYEGDDYYLVDTPGHTDFSAEMERSLGIMDYAIIVLSAVEGIEGHTETVWNLLRKRNIPTFIFLNKIDRVGAQPQEIIDEMCSEFSRDIVDITDLRDGEMSEELIEFIAERDERLLEMYLEGNYDSELWIRSFKKGIKNGEIFPLSRGAALKDIGVMEFFDNIHSLTYTDYKEGDDFSGRVFKVRYEEDGTKTTYIKALKGTLKNRDDISYMRDEELVREKVTNIYFNNGGKLESVSKVCAGEVFCVKGVKGAVCGDALGECPKEQNFEMVPMLRSRVVFSKEINVRDMHRAFEILGEEDPALNVQWNEDTKEIDIHIMGKIQLQILKDVVKERFGYDVDFMNPEIVYKESIESTVDGFGHFEPLKHYAEVHLQLIPGERGSGIQFENRCHTDYLSRGHMNLIKHHIFERAHRGILVGGEITDMKIVLMTGREHNKHTSGGDFREATFRAIRQGLEKANNVLLEPMYDFKIKASIDNMGRILTDIQKAHGSFEPPLNSGDKVIITGKAPVATFMEYPVEFMALTGGRGSLSLAFGGFDLCHNTDEVIEKSEYNKEADMIYSSTSIFCSKGQSYLVPWDRAEEEMHCLKK